jgi:hydrogenase nickel incorporation protein HypA/HybF
MHEIAVAESVVEAVGAHVGRAPVARVVLEIGRLTCVEPDAVRFCFEACARGTPVEGAVLEIVEIAGRARCRSCGAEDVEVDPRLPLCDCGSADLDVTQGQQLRVSTVEVA